ncbi:DJ-1/PfpI family protein [Mycoplasmopsis pulmonis]|uniref:DJ-1/PfpI family protein n=1 Tax=Mycoplasmopsis pulmonis TaxID=2107 RepID=UPI001005239C|nr:DJ-1/PfpI family protein [Mycoplasmopsis pulmonis]VEU68239.1 putative intracellular protease/amidase (putative glutaminase) [Mycoplasmopsis pulmonis]
MKLLTILHDQYQDIEYSVVMSILDISKTFDTMDVYNPDGQDRIYGQHKTSYADVSVKDLSKVSHKDYDAIFILGGKDVRRLADDQKTLKFIKDFYTSGKDLFVLCFASNVLFDSGIINEEKYVGYPLQNQKRGKNFTETIGIVRDKNLFTGAGAFSSFELGFTIVDHFQGEKKREQIKEIVKGFNI